MVLRNDLGGNPTLREVLLRAREMALAAYAHQDLPFDQVVDAVRPVRSLSRNPLFGVVVHVREELPAGPVIEAGSDGDTTFTALEPTFDVAHADLSLNFFATEDGYRGHVIYRTELYKRATAERLVRWLPRVLDAFADDPDQTLRDVQIAGRDERRQVQDFAAAAGVTCSTTGVTPSRSVSSATSTSTASTRRRPNFVQPATAPAGPRTVGWSSSTCQQRRVRRYRPGPSEPARTATEQTLAAILADVLALPKSAGTTTSSASVATASSPCSWRHGPATPGSR